MGVLPAAGSSTWGVTTPREFHNSPVAVGIRVSPVLLKILRVFNINFKGFLFFL